MSDILGAGSGAIVAATGLPSMIAVGLLRRAIKDTGGSEPPTQEQWLRAIPRIEARLRAYLDEASAKKHASMVQAAIEALAPPAC